MASNLGFSTAIVSDATATFERVGPDGRQWTAEEMHASALASLSEEFAHRPHHATDTCGGRDA
jgi:hypothetical protein